MAKIRVLVAKPGLDGHDRGAKVVARALRDAGFEVIYTGLRQTPEQITEAALQEDVDVIALSILSGAHPHLFPKVVELVRGKGMTDTLIIGGGVIPETDIPALKEAGIAAVFTPGTPTGDIVDFINEHVKKSVRCGAGSSSSAASLAFLRIMREISGNNGQFCVFRDFPEQWHRWCIPWT